jgi:hypothetical protein
MSTAYSSQARSLRHPGSHKTGTFILDACGLGDTWNPPTVRPPCPTSSHESDPTKMNWQEAEPVLRESPLALENDAAKANPHDIPKEKS